MMRKVVLLLALIFFGAVFSVQVARTTHLLRFMSSNVGAEPGSGLRLHSAYYGAEILNTLSKHAGYIQKNVLLASDYTYKLATFVSTLQSTVESDDDFGGFHTFPGERKEYEVYVGEFVSTVANSYFAGRVLEIGDSPLGGGQDRYLEKVNLAAALKFLSKSKKDDLYTLYPGADQVSMSSLYYGSKAWSLLSAHAAAPAGVTPAKPEAALKFLKSLFQDGGFKHSADATHADLQSTYQAVSLLKSLNLWDSFANKRNEVTEAIQRFILAHRDATTMAFGEKNSEPDVASTFWAVSVAKQLGLEHVVDAAAVVEFVASLQSFSDGGFKLHRSDAAGHYANTFYALETLETLGKVSVLEGFLVQQERVVLAPQFLHNAAFGIAIVLTLVAFAAALYILPRSKEEEGEEEETKDKATKKDKSLKKKRKEATITIIRNNVTKECQDKDGAPSLSKP